MSYYNQLYPATYQQNPYQPVQYQQPQMITPPTIRAEIVQVEDEASTDRWPLAAGSSQMFITKDEEHIIIKTMFANGQFSKDCYDKRPPEPPKPEVDMSLFVTRDEVSKLIDAAISAKRSAESEHE